MNCTAPEAELVAGLGTDTLAPADERAARRHLEACDECRADAAIVRELAATLRSLHLTPEELVAAAARRARPPHTRDCASCRDEYETLVAVNEGLREPPQRVPWLALAAALVVAVLGASYWRLEPAAPTPAPEDGRLGHAERRLALAEARLAQIEREATAPQLNVPIVDLEPSLVTRGGGSARRVVELPPTAATVTFVLVTRPMRPHDSYTLEVYDEGGVLRFVADGLLRSPYDTLTLNVPRTLLPPGALRFVLYGRRGGDREPVETYAVAVRHQP